MPLFNTDLLTFLPSSAILDNLFFLKVFQGFFSFFSIAFAFFSIIETTFIYKYNELLSRWGRGGVLNHAFYQQMH